MSNASVSRPESAPTSRPGPVHQPRIAPSASVATVEESHYHACPKCHRQQGVTSSPFQQKKHSWIPRLTHLFSCKNCGCQFRRARLSVWFAGLFFVWTLSMLVISLVK